MTTRIVVFGSQGPFFFLCDLNAHEHHSPPPASTKRTFGEEQLALHSCQGLTRVLFFLTFPPSVMTALREPSLPIPLDDFLPPPNDNFLIPDAILVSENVLDTLPFSGPLECSLFTSRAASPTVGIVCENSAPLRPFWPLPVERIFGHQVFSPFLSSSVCFFSPVPGVSFALKTP